MPERRNIFLHGLSLTLRRLPALLWIYAFNLALAFLFSISLNLHKDFYKRSRNFGCPRYHAPQHLWVVA